MDQTILQERLADRTGGTLYLTQQGKHYYIIIENKNTNFYELLLETKLKTAAEQAFELIFNASADDELKNQSVERRYRNVVFSELHPSVNE